MPKHYDKKKKGFLKRVKSNLADNAEQVAEKKHEELVGDLKEAYTGARMRMKPMEMRKKRRTRVAVAPAEGLNINLLEQASKRALNKKLKERRVRLEAEQDVDRGRKDAARRRQKLKEELALADEDAEFWERAKSGKKPRGKKRKRVR